MKLLTEIELESSCIVANNRMNRERVALGNNGYETDLQMDPIDYLQKIYQSQGHVAWLDLCCGRAKAIIETGIRFVELNIHTNSTLVGVDLVGMFDDVPSHLDFVSLFESPLRSWNSSQKFDLITSVHGLHYVGDKLSIISRAISMLRDKGRFIATLDLPNLRMVDSNQPNNAEKDFDFESLFLRRGFEFDSETRLLSFEKKNSNPFESDEAPAAQHFFGLTFAGADDQAGPNFTGQEAVNSYYHAATR
ncbi:MAG: class I SAM-dependent methyltransferase [Mariniblastus sp.]